MSKTVKRKRCAADNCRKLSSKTKDSIYCDSCLEETDPEEFLFEETKMLDEVEAEKWGRLDGELRNALLQNQIKQLEYQIAELKEKDRRRLVHEEELKLQRNFNNQQSVKKIESDKLIEEIKVMKARYEALTKALASKYGVDVVKMSIDPDTRVIRELDVP